jgi:hypothetical protein
VGIEFAHDGLFMALYLRPDVLWGNQGSMDHWIAASIKKNPKHGKH